MQAAKDWLGNLRGSYPSTGKPFAGWPPDIPDCPDDDQDSVPDLAERWELGLNMNRESTDRDKFDDGQELFGNTYCPGSGGYCGYGALPRNEDWGVIFAEMPSWVKVPGNHPLVAAYPVPEIDVVESSLHVETVTVVTTDHTISEGTERSYSTAVTNGTSSSEANTETWEEWQEVALTTEAVANVTAQVEVQTATQDTIINLLAMAQATTQASQSQSLVSKLAEKVLGRIAERGTDFVIDEACAELQCRKYAGSAVRAAVRTAVQIPDIVQEAIQSGKCSKDVLGKITCGLKAIGTTFSETYQQRLNAYTTAEQQSRGQTGGQAIDRAGDTFHIQTVYPVSYPVPSFTPTKTETRGSSRGGAHTVTHTQYEEHTVTNGEAFSNQESWGTATAVDSAHAADLWFSYKVRNTGTEYAREIGDLAFNIYIGDDPNPAYTYFVAPDLGGDGKFHNFMPGEEHTYTSRRIPLTLNQMRAIDVDTACGLLKAMGELPESQPCPGGKVRIVVEDFTYGIDELFYEDAANAGVIAAIEDGTDDGDEDIDTYLIPTWGEETVMDVLARYFPHETDVYNNLIAIWTPEYRADTPAWCVEPKVVGTGGQRTLWCKRALSTADWWNIYTNGLGDGSEGFQDTPAAPGSVALFRFNKDSDLDGYSDRSEIRLGTDPYDPADYPRPELIAGVHGMRSGDHVTATLSLLNTGLYDAYGVEAVMIAPDDSISITNNTVGGSGRVRALKQVVVGSRILLQTPLPDPWTQEGHAVPAAAGYYIGQQDHTYTFSAQCGEPGGCDVGSGTWSLAWDDSAGDSGTLNFGDGYASPTFLDVGGLGVTLALYTSKVYNGEAFTVEARTPRDTFQYTINREPYTEPVVIVSYNDPQGNHRFVIPPAAMALSLPTDDLMAYSGQMLQDPGVEIVTTETLTGQGTQGTQGTEGTEENSIFASSLSSPSSISSVNATNTVNLVINNPTETTLTDAHLFLEFVDLSGTVASEMPVTVTLPAGPTVVPVTWDTADFDPPYDADQDYIVMAFWTDYQGNILDTAGRPLSSFQEDPKPAFAMREADEVWDFGAVIQGETLERSFAFANTGFMDLLTYVSEPVTVTEWSPSTPISYPVGSHPVNVIGDGTHVWVTNYYDYTVTKLRADDGQNLGTFNVGSFPYGIAFDGTNIWVTNYGDATVSKVRASDGANLDTFPVDLHVWPILYDGANLWVTNWDDNTVRSIRPSDGETVCTAAVGTYHLGIAFDGTYVWVSDSGSNTVRKLRASDCTEAPGSPFTAGYGPWGLTYDGANIWAVTQGDGTVSKLRASDGALLGTYPVSSGSRDIASDGTSIWVTSWSSGTVTRLRASDGANLGTVVVGTSPEGITFDGASIWVANSGSNTVSKISSSPVPATSYTRTQRNQLPPADMTTYTVTLDTSGLPTGPYTHTVSIRTSDPITPTHSLTVRGTITDVVPLIWATRADMPTPRVGHGAATTTDDKILAIGGTSGGSLLASVEEYDPATNTWTTRASMPIARERLGVVAASNGKTYAIGGCITFTCLSALSDVEEYDPATNTWITRAPMPTARGYLGVAASNGKIYAIGGSAGGGSTATVEEYDLASNTWTNRASLPAPRSGLSAAASNGKIYAIGGFHGGPVSTVEEYDPATNTWTSRAAMPTPRGYLAVVTGIDGKLYAIGGTDGAGREYSTVEVYDPSTNAWRPATSMLTPRYGPGVTLANNGRIYAIGGWYSLGTSQIIKTVEEATLVRPTTNPSAGSDVTLSAADITFGAPNPTEGDVVPVSATLHNTSTVDSGPLTVAFFATPPNGFGETYIGAAFVLDVPAGGTADASIQWNTLCFAGDVPVRVVTDPYDRLDETDEDNNEATTNITILTRPDLHVPAIELSDPEPVAGQTVTVTLTISNAGQTDAVASALTLYEGNPESGGTLVDEGTPAVPGESETVMEFIWTPATPGPYRIFAVSDRDDAVSEFDEGNNQTWRDVYVGFAGPIELNSGGPTASDPSYASTVGYGVVDEGQADVLGNCGSAPYQTFRRDPGGKVVYRFDHLLRGHFYHLDLTLYECGQGAGRQEVVKVDGITIAGPEDLGDGEVHRLSILVDPALYADRTISVTVEAYEGLGAVVNEIALHDVDYRYADSGGGDDPQYPAVTALSRSPEPDEGATAAGDPSYGWLDGSPTNVWGTLPYQTARVDQDDNEVRYRFDGLDALKRYRVHLSFYQGSGANRTQKVQMDGVDTGTSLINDFRSPGRLAERHLNLRKQQV